MPSCHAMQRGGGPCHAEGGVARTHACVARAALRCRLKCVKWRGQAVPAAPCAAGCALAIQQSLGNASQLTAEAQTYTLGGWQGHSGQAKPRGYEAMHTQNAVMPCFQFVSMQVWMRCGCGCMKG